MIGQRRIVCFRSLSARTSGCRRLTDLAIRFATEPFFVSSTRRIDGSSLSTTSATQLVSIQSTPLELMSPLGVKSRLECLRRRTRTTRAAGWPSRPRRRPNFATPFRSLIEKPRQKSVHLPYLWNNELVPCAPDAKFMLLRGDQSETVRAASRASFLLFRCCVCLIRAAPISLRQLRRAAPTRGLDTMRDVVEYTSLQKGFLSAASKWRKHPQASSRMRTQPGRRRTQSRTRKHDKIVGQVGLLGQVPDCTGLEALAEGGLGSNLVLSAAQ